MQEIRGKCITVSANFTRPNDTSGYVAGDVVADSTSAATVMTFVLQGPGGNVGPLGSAMLETAVIVSSANQSTKPDFLLYLFDTAPETYGNDNEAFVPTDGEMRTLLQVVSFPAEAWVAAHRSSGTTGNAFCNPQSLRLPINTTKSANAIYGVLVADAAYTPIAQERFDIRLGLVL